MKRSPVLFAATACVAVFPFIAAAQTRHDRRPTVPAAETTSYQTKTHIDITDGETVEGGVARPTGDVVDGRRRLRQPSLLQLRVDFRREMLKAAEDI